MNFSLRNLFVFSTLFLIFAVSAQAQLKAELSDTLNAIANREQRVGNVVVQSVQIKKKEVRVKTNVALSSLPFRDELVAEIYGAIRACLPSRYRKHKLRCEVGGYAIEDLVPNYFRKKHIDDKRIYKDPAADFSLIRNLSQANKISKGLQNRHIALWHSHGYYYDQKEARWEWQRSRLFQTVEDLYAMGYVLPFLAPMLENAGATVLIPRERDTQKEELLVDNDKLESSSDYFEQNGTYAWEQGREAGFANKKDFYLHGENPFRMGTYRQAKTTNNKDKASHIIWRPNFPTTGSYAVYISYKSLPKSSPSAHYTLYHKGGKTEFEVNQTMSGGTWLYLGHFDFHEGKSEQGKLVLSNFCKEKNNVVTADAVKFGGGMGNIARQPYEKKTIINTNIEALKARGRKAMKDFSVDTIVPSQFYSFEASAYPRFAEGARYWLQWAGIPDSIYSRSAGLNDYTDDFQSRGFWVNYLAGGSRNLPKQDGLNVPIDLALAFHSDAGLTPNDSIIGTLAICSTKSTEGKKVYKNRASRLAARDMTDIIQTQIVNDIRLLHEPNWTRRAIWDRSYSESREPEVPTMLLELLSHQNFADMRYGLDPRFRFTVSRAIYKGILKYIHSVYGGKYQVQPLPVEQFSSRFVGDNKLDLSWQAVKDPLEPTATATHYILYTRIDNGAFDNGVVVKKNHHSLKVDPDKIYSFKVAAANKGGESFPSEILSACRHSNSLGDVLIVNGFDRISAPGSFQNDSIYAGFSTRDDAGVPYLYDISFTGEQHEFLRSKGWTSDDSPGHGASYGNYETLRIAGNSFDYPALHGRAIKEAGYSFVSCSKSAVLESKILLTDYKIVDLILGKQKETFIGNRQKESEFKIFPLSLQQRLEQYCKSGGSLMLSGAYFASEMSADGASKEDKKFLETVLACKFRVAKAALTGKLRTVDSPFTVFEKRKYSYYNEPNSESYYIESPDAIEPINKQSYTICRYVENNLSAGIACETARNRICALAFPFETIKEEGERNVLMSSILKFFSSEKKNLAEF